jgi:hypothetical protein
MERDDLVALGERGVIEDGVDEVVEAGGSLRALPRVCGGRGSVLSLRPLSFSNMVFTAS